MTLAWFVHGNMPGPKAAVQCAEPAPALDSTGWASDVSMETTGPAQKGQTIALLGATGNTGKHVLQLALARGHKVKALVRDPAKLNKLDVAGVRTAGAQLETVQGSATDVEAVRKLVQNADVVVSCIGGTSRGDTIMTTTATNLLEVMGPSGARLVMMTSLGCGGTSPTVKFGLGCLFGFGQVTAIDEADRMIREGAKFPYVLVRPPRIDKALEGTGKYNATVEFPWLCPIACGITEQDVAMCPGSEPVRQGRRWRPA